VKNNMVKHVRRISCAKNGGPRFCVMSSIELGVRLTFPKKRNPSGDC